MKYYNFILLSILTMLIFYSCGDAGINPIVLPTPSSTTVTATPTQSYVNSGEQRGKVYIPNPTYFGGKKLIAAQKDGMIILLGDNPPPFGYIPLSGATVTIGNKVFTTNSDGTFNATSIEVGLQLIRVEHPDYVGFQSLVPIIPVLTPTANPTPIDPNIPYTPVPSPTQQGYTDFTITINNLKTVVGRGGEYQFFACGFDSAGLPVIPDIIWTITGEIGTIDRAGLFTATNTGKGKVTATNNNGSAAQADIEVAGGTGTVYGVAVYNSQPLPGAVITVKNTGITVKTDNTGYYSIEGVPEGDTTIYATSANPGGGFGGTSVNVIPDQNTEANIFLEIIPTPTPVPIQPGITPTPAHIGIKPTPLIIPMTTPSPLPISISTPHLPPPTVTAVPTKPWPTATISSPTGTPVPTGTTMPTGTPVPTGTTMPTGTPVPTITPTYGLLTSTPTPSISVTNMVKKGTNFNYDDGTANPLYFTVTGTNFPTSGAKVIFLTINPKTGQPYYPEQKTEVTINTGEDLTATLINGNAIDLANGIYWIKVSSIESSNTSGNRVYYYRGRDNYNITVN